MPIAMQRVTGVVRRMGAKSFGFAECDGHSVFFHLSDFVDQRVPEIGDLLEFEMENTERGFKARKVRVIPDYDQRSTNG